MKLLLGYGKYPVPCPIQIKPMRTAKIPAVINVIRMLLALPTPTRLISAVRPAELLVVAKYDLALGSVVAAQVNSPWTLPTADAVACCHFSVKAFLASLKVRNTGERV